MSPWLFPTESPVPPTITPLIPLCNSVILAPLTQVITNRMAHLKAYHGLARLVALAWLGRSPIASPCSPPLTPTTVAAVSARHGYGGGGDGEYTSGRGGWYNDDDGDDGLDADSAFGRGSSGSDTGFGRDGAGAPFDITQAMNYGRIHGILAALAFVVLFPVGSVLMRVVPGRFAIWAHAAAQVLGFGTYVAAAGLGIYLVTIVRTPAGGLVRSFCSAPQWC